MFEHLLSAGDHDLVLNDEILVEVVKEVRGGNAATGEEIAAHPRVVAHGVRVLAARRSVYEGMSV
jgi:hypothetical protein